MTFHEWRINLFSSLFLTIYMLQYIEKWFQGFQISSGSTVIQHCESCCQCCCWCDLSVTCLLIMSDSCCEMIHRVFVSLRQQVKKHKKYRVLEVRYEKNSSALCYLKSVVWPSYSFNKLMSHHLLIKLFKSWEMYHNNKYCNIAIKKVLICFVWGHALVHGINLGPWTLN